jgi:hypothetical protein
MNSVFKKILLFTVGLVIFPSLSYAATILDPGDLMIITVNSDTNYPGGVNSNAFDFITKVDIEEGTEIYFTDVGWTGSAWRNPSSEGVLRYTTPIGGITRGTIVKYDDSLATAAPWTRLSLNSTTGVLTLGGSYDPAAAGDNILVFQGATLSPDFIYGIGWGNNTPWITTGIASANNSYIPLALSGAASTLVTLGNQDNYQYNCSVTGISSPLLSSSIANPANWNVDDVGMFGTSPCTFDVSDPRVNSITRFNPIAATTNASTLVFRIEFSETVSNVSVADFVLSAGSLASTINSISPVSSTVYDVTVQGYSGDGTINIDISAANDIQDASGNPLSNLVVVGADESFTIDTTPDAAPATPDLATASDTGSSSSDNVTTDTTPSFTLSCVTGSTVTIYNNGTPLTPTGVCSGGTITLTPTLTEGTHSITATQTDTAGNTSATSAPVLVVIIDATAPTTPGIQSVGGDTTSPYLTNDNTPAVVITTELGDTVTIPGFTCTPTPATGTTVTCTLTTPYTDGTHSFTPTITDQAGNATVGVATSVTVDATAPTTPVVTSPTSYVDNYTPTITGTGEIGSFITLVLNGNTYNTTVDALGIWSVAVAPALADGNYPYSVTAADGLGNISSPLNTSLTVSTTPQPSSSSSASVIRYVCKDPKATNYESFGRHKPSLCKYGSTTTTPVTTPTTDNPFGGEQCPSNQLITDNMKNGDTNGVYSSYNKGKVTQISILQAHINRILGDEYTQAAGPVDDYFRTKTKLGVERLQQRLNQLLPTMKPLVIDGIVGAYTKAAINKSC